MIKTTSVILALGISSAFASTPCVPNADPSDYLVFASNGMNLSSGDFQGLTGSGGNVRVSHFAFAGNHRTCAGLIGAADIKITDGSVDHANLETRGNVTIVRGRVDGKIITLGKIRGGDSYGEVHGIS